MLLFLADPPPLPPSQILHPSHPDAAPSPPPPPFLTAAVGRGASDPCCITGGFWSNCFVRQGFCSGWLITRGRRGEGKKCICHQKFGWVQNNKQQTQSKLQSNLSQLSLQTESPAQFVFFFPPYFPKNCCPFSPPYIMILFPRLTYWEAVNSGVKTVPFWHPIRVNSTSLYSFIQYSPANKHRSAYITVSEKKTARKKLLCDAKWPHYYHKNHIEAKLGFVRHLMGLNSIEDNLSWLLQCNSIRPGDVQKLVSFKAAQSQHIA